MPPEYHRIPPRAVRIPVPDTSQLTDSTCGSSALQAVCKYYGVGPEDEPEYVEDMGMKKPEEGSDPEHIIRAAKKYRLRIQEFYPMSVEELKRCLTQRRPVILMLQAWGTEKGRPRRSYKRIWKDGHWVVAIGYDKKGVFFEDPSLQAIRGYLSFSELEERWHDFGPNREHMDHYGLAVWKPRASGSVYERRAQRIE